jgi:hypothetical protein
MFVKINLLRLRIGDEQQSYWAFAGQRIDRDSRFKRYILCSSQKKDVFVGAIGGFSIPLAPAIAVSNSQNDGRHLVNP